MAKQSGLTLIELMVAVAIVAILAAVAVPMYGDYVRRARLVAGTTLLSDARVRAEQFFQDNRTFTGFDAAGIGLCDAVRDNFKLTCALTATTYTLTATGQGAAAGFVFTIDERNRRATTGVPADWTTNATCWVIKKGGLCS